MRLTPSPIARNFYGSAQNVTARRYRSTIVLEHRRISVPHFTPPLPPFDCIIDNLSENCYYDPAKWQLFSPVPSAYANTFHSNIVGQETEYFTYYCDVPVLRDLHLYEYHPYYPRGNGPFPVLISYYGGDFPTTVDPYANCSQWNLVGTWPFGPDAAYVRINSDATCWYAYADAWRWTSELL